MCVRFIVVVLFCLLWLGNPENKDQSTQRVIERDKLQSASARKDAPILDPIIDKAVNGLLSATTEGPQEGMRHGNIYKKRLEEMNALKKEEVRGIEYINLGFL